MVILGAGTAGCMAAKISASKGFDVFQIFLQGSTNEELNYGMKYQLIAEEDVLKASLGEEIRLNIGEATRRIFIGLGRLSFLRSLYVMARTIQEIRSLYSKHPSAPDVFSGMKKENRRGLQEGEEALLEIAFLGLTEMDVPAL